MLNKTNHVNINSLRLYKYSFQISHTVKYCRHLNDGSPNFGMAIINRASVKGYGFTGFAFNFYIEEGGSKPIRLNPVDLCLQKSDRFSTTVYVSFTPVAHS